MAILKIGSTDLPSPSDLQIGVMDLNKGERNTNGTLILERIATKRKLEITWSFLTAAELSTILNLVSNTFFTCTYTDPVTNSNRTGTFYAGDRTSGVMDVKNGTVRYKDLKFNIIER